MHHHFHPTVKSPRKSRHHLNRSYCGPYHPGGDGGGPDYQGCGGSLGAGGFHQGGASSDYWGGGGPDHRGSYGSDHRGGGAGPNHQGGGGGGKYNGGHNRSPFSQLYDNAYQNYSKTRNDQNLGDQNKYHNNSYS